METQLQILARTGRKCKSVSKNKDLQVTSDTENIGNFEKEQIQQSERVASE